MSIYGNKGIDTSYERDLFERRVRLEYPEKSGNTWLPSSNEESIQRAREFSITNVINGYENLLERIQTMIRVIQMRNKDNFTFDKFQSELSINGYKSEAIKIENKNSDIRGSIDYELYGLLIRLYNSVSMQIDFQYDNYASQFIDNRSLEDLSLAENNSISLLASLESSLYGGYYEESHENVEKTEILDMESQEKQIRSLSLLHLTNGDVSFSHLNRQSDLEIIISLLEDLTYYSNELLGENVENLIMSVFSMENKEALKTQILVKFSSVRMEHEGNKGKYKGVADSVEKFASEATYIQKKIKEVSTEDTMQWLYTKDEEESEAFDGLAEILVGGITESEKTYEISNGSMTNLYKTESNYFASQIQYIQDKEKMRLYFRIIEDLEGKSTIDSEWIEGYLSINGY